MSCLELGTADAEVATAAAATAAAEVATTAAIASSRQKKIRSVQNTKGGMRNHADRYGRQAGRQWPVKLPESMPA